MLIFLIVPIALANASIGRPDVVRSNIRIFNNYSANLSQTNSLIASWEPLSNAIREEGRRGRTSAKQWHFSINLGTAIACCFIMLFTLLLTHGVRISQGFALTLWLFLFIPFLGMSHESDWQGWVVVLSPTIIIALRNEKIGTKLASLIILVAILLGISLLIITRNKFEYLNDYSFPEFLTTSSLTNIVVHEKIDLPYRLNRYGRKWVVFEGDRIERRISEEDLLRLLDIQAIEVTNYLKKVNNQK